VELPVPSGGFSIPNIFWGTLLKRKPFAFGTFIEFVAYYARHNLFVESIKNQIGYFFKSFLEKISDIPASSS
jgi:hypothetical protein